MANQELAVPGVPRPERGEASAVKFLNEPLRRGAARPGHPAQQRDRLLLWLEPGSLGDGASRPGSPQEFPAPNGEADAVTS